MKKVILLQSPAKFYEAVPVFYKEGEQFGFWDKYYIVTDFKGPYDVGDKCEVHTLQKDRQFSTNMLKLLPSVEEDIFFVCCEDHILKGHNDHEVWQRCFDFVVNTADAGYLRLTNNNRIQLENRKRFIAPIKNKDKYYTSLQPGIWRKTYFECALSRGEDAWRFEINGANRTKRHRALRSYCVQKTIFGHTNLYKSGKHYRHKFAEYAIRNGLKLKTDKKIIWKGKLYTFEQYAKIYEACMKNEN